MYLTKLVESMHHGRFVSCAARAKTSCEIRHLCRPELPRYILHHQDPWFPKLMAGNHHNPPEERENSQEQRHIIFCNTSIKNAPKLRGANPNNGDLLQLLNPDRPSSMANGHSEQRHSLPLWKIVREKRERDSRNQTFFCSPCYY